MFNCASVVGPVAAVSDGGRSLWRTERLGPRSCARQPTPPVRPSLEDDTARQLWDGLPSPEPRHGPRVLLRPLRLTTLPVRPRRRTAENVHGSGFRWETGGGKEVSRGSAKRGGVVNCLICVALRLLPVRSSVSSVRAPNSKTKEAYTKPKLLELLHQLQKFESQTSKSLQVKNAASRKRQRSRIVTQWPNAPSTPETLGNWADGRISCRHSTVLSS